MVINLDLKSFENLGWISIFSIDIFSQVFHYFLSSCFWSKIIILIFFYILWIFDTPYYKVLINQESELQILQKRYLNKISLLRIVYQSKVYAGHVLVTITSLWQVAQWVSRTPPHNTLPAFLSLNVTKVHLDCYEYFISEIVLSMKNKSCSEKLDWSFWEIKILKSSCHPKSLDPKYPNSTSSLFPDVE